MNIEKEIEEAQALVESLKAKQAEQAEQKKKRTGKIMFGSELEQGQAFYASLSLVWTERYTDPSIDGELIALGKAYFDRESAELALEKAKIIHRMAIAARECIKEADWSDGGKPQCYLYWDFYRGKAGIAAAFAIKSSPLPHFTDKHRLEAFRDSLSAHELWVLLVWEGDL